MRRHVADHSEVPKDASQESQRAALFFLQRQTHHWGEVPADSEAQMRALVAAIGARTETGWVVDDDFS